MNKFVKKFAGTLAFAAITGCVSQGPIIPLYLKPVLSHRNIQDVSSISYEDEDGTPMTEQEFSARYEKTHSFEVQTRPRANGAPDVTARLRPKGLDEANSLRLGVMAPGAQSFTSFEAVDFGTCAAPLYPQDDLLAKHTGTVTLNFLVGADGYVKKSQVASSSGHPGLDLAALSALSRCRFKPVLAKGVPVERWRHVQFVWSM